MLDSAAETREKMNARLFQWANPEDRAGVFELFCADVV
jgi:hypothetical protein